MVEMKYNQIQSPDRFDLEPLELFEYFSYKLLSDSEMDINSLVKELKEGFNAKQNFQINFHTHEDKTSFYNCSEKLFNLLLDLKLSQDTTSLVVSSFLEVVDNAFTHNLGKWPTKYYKRVASLFLNDLKKKTFTIAVADLGVGFKETLKLKHPEIQSEIEAVELAIQANTSSRPVDYKGQRMGGNGLYFLQKNIFNGLAGKLFIRSCGDFCEILSANQVQQLANSLPYTYGTNIFFELSYA
ncbi:MAG: hypothetical protein ACKO3R_05195 [bacterium]